MKKKILILVGSLLLAWILFEIISTAKNDQDAGIIPYITDVNRYSEVMKSITPATVIEHFPENIPFEASDVKFAYQPRRGQVAMFLELLMVLPEDQVNEIWKKYSGFVKYQFTEEKTIEDIPEPILFLISDENHNANQDFAIFLITADPAGSENFIWNHGTMYGVGINKITLQVIYWLEYW